jgi:hypothetical protein
MSSVVTKVCFRSAWEEAESGSYGLHSKINDIPVSFEPTQHSSTVGFRSLHTSLFSVSARRHDQNYAMDAEVELALLG